MLRYSKIILAGGGALALLSGGTAFAQLAPRLDAATQKLSQDEQNCREVNLAEYARLLEEANQNKQRGEKAKKKGVPVDETQINADLARAMQLFARAQAAQARQCMMHAQGVQPQPQAVAGSPLGHGEQAGNGAAAGGVSGTCPAGPPPKATPASESDARPRIPSHDQIDKMAEEMEKAVKDVRTGDAEVIRGAIEAEGSRLRQIVKDAKHAGEFTNVDVREAQDRLKQIDAWLDWAAKHGVTGCQPSLQPQSRAQESPNLGRFEQTMFDKTNALRASYGVPPLRWSPLLASNAKARSVQNAQAGELVHAPREGRGKERENISKAPASYGDAQIFDLWGNEDFVSGTFPNVCTSGDWQTCAHKSAILWPTTEEMGCSKTLSGIWWWIVCRYYPGGNKDGQFVGRMPANYVEKVAATDGQETTVIPSSANAQLTLNYDYGYDGGLFVGYDLGAFRLEAEVAYKRANIPDVYDVAPPGSGKSSALSFMINSLLDFGPDDGLSAQVGGGLTVGRIHATSARPLGGGLDPSDFNLYNGIIDSLPSRAADPGIETEVQPPVLPTAEVFKAAGGAVPSNGGSDEPMVVRTAPLFDIGTSAGGAWSSSWFDSPSPDFPDGDTFFIFDPGRIIEGSAPQMDTKIAPPELPNVEIYKVVPSGDPLEWM